MHLYVIPWDVNPEIFRIGSFAIRWYGLLFASAFLFGYIIMLRIFRNENLTEALLDKLTIYMAVGTIVGARLDIVSFMNLPITLQTLLRSSRYGTEVSPVMEPQ